MFQKHSGPGTVYTRACPNFLDFHLHKSHLLVLIFKEMYFLLDSMLHNAQYLAVLFTAVSPVHHVQPGRQHQLPLFVRLDVMWEKSV